MVELVFPSAVITISDESHLSETKKVISEYFAKFKNS